MGNTGMGLFLMAIGMTTVFIILLIVIFGSKGVICLVNRFAPRGEQPPARSADGGCPDARTMKILEAAVAQITGGKGHISNVKSVSHTK